MTDLPTPEASSEDLAGAIKRASLGSYRKGDQRLLLAEIERLRGLRAADTEVLRAADVETIAEEAFWSDETLAEMREVRRRAVRSWRRVVGRDNEPEART